MNPRREEVGKRCMKGLFCEFARDGRMTEYIRAWESRMEASFRTFFDTVPCSCCAAPDTDRVARFLRPLEGRRGPHRLTVSTNLCPPLFKGRMRFENCCWGGAERQHPVRYCTRTLSPPPPQLSAALSLAATEKVHFYDNPRINLSTSSLSSP